MVAEKVREYKKPIVQISLAALIGLIGGFYGYWQATQDKISRHDEKIIILEKTDNQMGMRLEKIEGKIDDLKESFHNFKIEIIKEIKNNK